MIREDKFKVGDKVTWANDDYATMTTNCRETYGDGPFEIVSVDESCCQYRFMGHTQHVTLNHGGNNVYSGAFFKLVEENSAIGG